MGLLAPAALLHPAPAAAVAAAAAAFELPYRRWPSKPRHFREA